MATTKQTSIYPINVQFDGKFDVNMLERQLRSAENGSMVHRPASLNLNLNNRRFRGKHENGNKPAQAKFNRQTCSIHSDLEF